MTRESIAVRNDYGINKLTIANKMILNNQYAEETFLNIVKNIYQAKLDSIDGINANILSVIDETNKWISELTNHKIKTILGKYFECASIALINVIYFNYEWMHRFDKNLTMEQPFFKSRENKISVEMMMLSSTNLPYYFSKKLNAHILTLPYQQEKFEFTVIFPDEEKNFLLKDDDSSLVNKLNYQLLNEELKNRVYKKVDLQIPKFKIENELEV